MKVFHLERPLFAEYWSAVCGWGREGSWGSQRSGGSEGDEEFGASPVRKGWERWGCSQGWRRGGSGRELTNKDKHLIGGVENTEPGSFQFCPVTDQS